MEKYYIKYKQGHPEEAIKKAEEMGYIERRNSNRDRGLLVLNGMGKYYFPGDPSNSGIASLKSCGYKELNLEKTKFKVGDKVKFSRGKTIYTIIEIKNSICDIISKGKIYTTKLDRLIKVEKVFQTVRNLENTLYTTPTQKKKEYSLKEILVEHFKKKTFD